MEKRWPRTTSYRQAGRQAEAAGSPEPVCVCVLPSDRPSAPLACPLCPRQARWRDGGDQSQSEPTVREEQQQHHRRHPCRQQQHGYGTLAGRRAARRTTPTRTLAA